MKKSIIYGILAVVCLIVELYCVHVIYDNIDAEYSENRRYAIGGLAAGFSGIIMVCLALNSQKNNE